MKVDAFFSGLNLKRIYEFDIGGTDLNKLPPSCSNFVNKRVVKEDAKSWRERQQKLET